MARCRQVFIDSFYHQNRSARQLPKHQYDNSPRYTPVDKFQDDMAIHSIPMETPPGHMYVDNEEFTEKLNKANAAAERQLFPLSLRLSTPQPIRQQFVQAPKHRCSPSTLPLESIRFMLPATPQPQPPIFRRDSGYMRCAHCLLAYEEECQDQRHEDDHEVRVCRGEGQYGSTTSLHGSATSLYESATSLCCIHDGLHDARAAKIANSQQTPFSIGQIISIW